MNGDKKMVKFSTHLLLNLALVNGLINALINYCVGFIIFHDLERIFVLSKGKNIIVDTFIMTSIVVGVSMFITLRVVDRHFGKFNFILDVGLSRKKSNFLFGEWVSRMSLLKAIIVGIFLGGVFSFLMRMIFSFLRINSLSFQQVLRYKVAFSFILAFFVSFMAGATRAAFLQEERIDG